MFADNIILNHLISFISTLEQHLDRMSISDGISFHYFNCFVIELVDTATGLSAQVFTLEENVAGLGQRVDNLEFITGNGTIGSK